MLLSLRHGFVVLSMPKCASTSLVQALSNLCDITFRHRMKHVDYAFVETRVIPMVRDKLAAPGRGFEVFCLFREPVQWLYSWYRYDEEEAARRAPQPRPGAGRFAGFPDFVEAYLSPRPPRVGGVLRQSDFIRNAAGRIGDVRLFRFEDHAALIERIRELTGQRIELKVTNQSRWPREADFTGLDLARLRDHLALEYAIYDAIPASSDSLPAAPPVG